MVARARSRPLKEIQRDEAPPPPGSSRLGKAEVELRTTGLAMPEAYEEFPWGHRALKVNGKAFAFLVG